MTYCVGVLLKDGLVLGSDSRTHAGVDDFASFRKMTVLEQPGYRVLVLLSSGSLAGTQAVISVLTQNAAVEGDGTDGPPSLMKAQTMFNDAQQLVGRHAHRLDLLRARHSRSAKAPAFVQGAPYFGALSKKWSEGVRAAFKELPDPQWGV